MIAKKRTNTDRPTLSDEELDRLSIDDILKIKFSDDETSRLRAINDRRRQDLERRVAEWRKAEQPLARELQAAGFDVESAWDLFNRKEPWNKKERIRPYLEVLPILLEHLQRPYPDRVREGIARALAEGRKSWLAVGLDVRDVWAILTRLYRKEKSGTDAKEGLAVAISALAESDDNLLDLVIALIKDRQHGESRLYLMSVLEHSTDPKARAALMELGTDPDLIKEVQRILKKLRSKELRSKKRKAANKTAK